MLKVRRLAPMGAGDNGNPLAEGKVKDALRVGMCGIGRAGLGMVRRDLAALPQIRVMAGFDLLEERGRQLAAMCGSRICSSYDELLADEELELIIVATRSSQHVAMALEALKAGKHVLVEKPMALDVAGADRLIAAARKYGRKLFVRHNRRFDAPFLTAMEIVKSGKIGKLFSVQLRQGGYQRRADWQAIKKFGGGQMLNWGPHVIDWALQFVGGKAADVWSDLKLIAAAGDAEDHVKLLIRGRSGIVVDIEVSGAAAIAQPPWLLMGSHGSLLIDSRNRCRLRYFDARKLPKARASDRTPQGRAGSHFSGGEGIEWIEQEFAAAPKKPVSFWVELYKAVRRGKAFPVTLEEARETMRVISLAKKGTKF